MSYYEAAFCKERRGANVIPVDVAQNDPIYIIRLQASSRETLNYVMVAAYWMARLDVFPNWLRVRGERLAEPKVEKKTGGRRIVLCSGARRRMLY